MLGKPDIGNHIPTRIGLNQLEARRIVPCCASLSAERAIQIEESAGASRSKRHRPTLMRCAAQVGSVRPEKS